MDRNSFVKYHPELQVIADFLNHKLFDHEDYLKNSFVFICGIKKGVLIVDIVDIDFSIPRYKKLSVLELMSSIANENDLVIKNAFKEIISTKTFPKPTNSQTTIQNLISII